MKKHFAPSMRVIIRDEELYCTGISPLVKDKEAIFFLKSTIMRKKAVVLKSLILHKLHWFLMLLRTSAEHSCIWKASGGSRFRRMLSYISAVKQKWT